MNCAIAVLEELLECLLTQRHLSRAEKFLSYSPLSLLNTGGPELRKCQSVLTTARMRFVLLTGDIDEALSFVGGVEGNNTGRSGMHDALFSYAAGRWDEALSAAKDALFSFQKAGNHKGETYSHIELALALLAAGNVRDALEHFSIARRIGTQINAVWGVCGPRPWKRCAVSLWESFEERPGMQGKTGNLPIGRAAGIFGFS